MRKYRDSILPSLFGDYADYGTIDPLFPATRTATPDQLDRLAADDSCEVCGLPTQGLGRCDTCIDLNRGR